MGRNPKNTNTGIRWVCADCALDDGRKIVAAINGSYPDSCKLCRGPLAVGQKVFALDAGVRKRTCPNCDQRGMVGVLADGTIVDADDPNTVSLAKCDHRKPVQEALFA